MSKRTLKMILAALCFAIALWLGTTGLASAHDGVGGDEYAAADIMLIVALASFASAGLALIWSIRNGELHDPENIKYRMLDLALTGDDGEELNDYAETTVDDYATAQR